MTISVLITGVVFNAYGQQYPIGQVQALADDFGASIVAAGLGTSSAYPAPSSPLFEAYPTGTLSQMWAAAPMSGARFHTSDSFLVNGAASPIGTDWIGDGTQWRPRGMQRVIVSTTVVNGLQQTAEQVIKSLTIPAGLLYLQRFQLEYEVGKSGATDAMSQVNIRLGPTGTTADGYLTQTGLAIMTAAKRSVGYANTFDVTGVATAQKRGSGGGSDNQSFGGLTSATALSTPATLTGANLLTTAQILTFAGVMTAAAADSPQIGGVYITLLP